MKIQITKLSSPGFEEEFSTVKEAFEFFRDRCICGSCKVTQSQLQRTEDMSDDDYTYEQMNMIRDDWEDIDEWIALNELWSTSCGCEYDVTVID